MTSGQRGQLRQLDLDSFFTLDSNQVKTNTQKYVECSHKHYHPRYVENQIIDVIYQPPKYTLEQLEQNRIISYEEIITKYHTSLCKNPPGFAAVYCNSESLPCETGYFPCGINYHNLNWLFFNLSVYNFKDSNINRLNKPGAYVIIPYNANKIYIPEQQHGFDNTFEKIITKKCDIPLHGTSELSESVMFIGSDNKVWISIFKNNQ